MKCKIIRQTKNYLTLEIPNEGQYEYFRNERRNCLVGKNSVSIYNIDIFSFTNETATEIEIQKVDVRVTPEDYLEFAYEKNNVVGWESVHAAVAYCWLIKPLNYKTITYQIDHVDGNKHRNIPENLEYVLPHINLWRAVRNQYTGAIGKFVSIYFTNKTDVEMFQIMKDIVEDEEKNLKN